MYYKMVLAVFAGLLPLATLGDGTNAKSSASALSGTTNAEPWNLRLKITCRSGAVMILDKAELREQGSQKRGTIPPVADATAIPSVRLDLPEAGTVTIPWDDIEKITVGERGTSEKTYPIEVTLKKVKQAKVGKTLGYDNTIVGQSDAGQFSIQLKDVVEIVTLPTVDKK